MVNTVQYNISCHPMATNKNFIKDVNIRYIVQYVCNGLLREMQSRQCSHLMVFRNQMHSKVSCLAFGLCPFPYKKFGPRTHRRSVTQNFWGEPYAAH